MAIGPVLQEARLKRQLTASQVAEMTRMKVQIVDDLEHDDFHRIAATIYGKGFIKLFAECVGLDPAPLIADYLRTVRGEDAPAADEPPAPAPPEPAEEPEPAPPQDLFAYARTRKRTVSPAPPAVKADPPRDASPAGDVKRRTRSEREPLSAQVRKGLAYGHEQGRLLLEDLRNRLADLNWNDRFLRRLGIALAVAVVILILIPVVRHMASGKSHRPLADQDLLLFTEPPEPYVE